MSKKRTITTYLIDRKEIEGAVLVALKKKYPELSDDIDTRLVFYYSDGKGFGPQARLDASIEFVHEIEIKE